MHIVSSFFIGKISLSFKNSGIRPGSEWNWKLIQTPFETTGNFLSRHVNNLIVMSFPEGRKATENSMLHWPKHEYPKRPLPAVAFSAGDKIVKRGDKRTIFSQNVDLYTLSQICQNQLYIVDNKRDITRTKQLFIRRHFRKTPFKTFV